MATGSYQQIDPANIDSEFFEVVGAGKIQIGKLPDNECGDAKGFHVGVEWGNYGYAGGVIDKEEAKRLADFIYDRLGHMPLGNDYITIKDNKMEIENED